MIRVENGYLKLTGAITMDSAPRLFKQGCVELKKQVYPVDLSEVTSVDSSAVSLLLGWMRVVKAQQQGLHIINYPDDLRSLIDLYSLEEILPLQAC